MAVAIALVAVPFAIAIGWFARREMRRRAYRRITILGELIVTARAHPEKNSLVWVEKAEEHRLRGKQEFDEGNNYIAGFLQLRNSETALKTAAGDPTARNRAERRALQKRGSGSDVQKMAAAHVVGADGSVRIVRPQPRHQGGGKRRKRR